MKISWLLIIMIIALSTLSATGCASNIVSSQVSGMVRNYGIACARDDDPELVWAATPFVLKAIDGRLVASPGDTILLLAATSSYTRYAYGSLAADADFIEKKDYERAKELRLRAGHLLLRARDYGLRGMAGHEGMPEFLKRLHDDPAGALSAAKAADVPLMYWTACAWGAAISLAKEDAELTADQFVVEAIMRKVLELDEEYDSGAPHDFMIAFEGARAGVGGSYEKAEEHFGKAVKISDGRRAAPYMTYAESVLLPRQKRAEFVKMLEEALRITPDADPDNTLANVIAQRRARWLLNKVDELFLEQ